MGGERRVGKWLVEVNGRGLAFFVLAIALAVGGYYFYRSQLHADQPLADSPNQVTINLNSNGNLYLGNVRLPAQVFQSSGTYRYRYQVIDQPADYLDSLVVDVKLPKPATNQQLAYDFISNGGAVSTTSKLANPTTVEYAATGISTQAQLSIELQVPQSFVTQSLLFQAQQYLANLPAYIWLGISLGLPLVTLLILLSVGLGRIRRVAPLTSEINSLPSRLPPAILGILWRGRLTNRELAATLLDLARRGHLVIRQVSMDDFRFRRLESTDKLYDYEQMLLEQIFGPTGDKANSEEISFGLAQEVFSQRVSQAFILAYRKMSELGYFYTNPLSLHRRYQVGGIILFLIGGLGFAANLILLPGIRYSLLFWVGMMAAALSIIYFSRGLPVRTIYGDREVAKWLAFRRYLVEQAPINYVAHSQEKYLSYLPYAIVFEAEREWTKRFYSLPFSQPSWYVAANISTIDDFANTIFPLFGYLSHALALTVQPAAQ